MNIAHRYNFTENILPLPQLTKLPAIQKLRHVYTYFCFNVFVPLSFGGRESRNILLLEMKWKYSMQYTQPTQRHMQNACLCVRASEHHCKDKPTTFQQKHKCFAFGRFVVGGNTRWIRWESHGYLAQTASNTSCTPQYKHTLQYTHTHTQT